MTNLEAIKRKIQALKAIANDSAATEGEVNNALALAHKLCREYDLEFANIEDKQVIEEELRVNAKTRNLRDYKIGFSTMMSKQICRLFECEHYYNHVLMTETIIGTELDRNTADYCIDFAHNSMDACWNKYKRSEEYAILRQRYKSKQLKKDFMNGFCLGVCDKCEDLIKGRENVVMKTTGTSLMVIKSTAVEKFMENIKLKASKRRPVRCSSERTIESGKEQGRAIEFTKPISGARNTCQLLQG